MKHIILFTAAVLVGTGISNAQQQMHSTRGVLIIKSPSEALVSLDGQGAYLVVPSINLRLDKLTPGYHKITAVVDSQKWSTAVKIKAGTITTVTANIKGGQGKTQNCIQPNQHRLPAAATINRKSPAEVRKQQEQYEHDFDERIKRDLQQQEEDYARAQRARKLKLQREAQKYEEEKNKYKKKKKRRVRRPKVH
jgi:hypothetical protein